MIGISRWSGKHYCFFFHPRARDPIFSRYPQAAKCRIKHIKPCRHSFWLVVWEMFYFSIYWCIYIYIYIFILYIYKILAKKDNKRQQHHLIISQTLWPMALKSEFLHHLPADAIASSPESPPSYFERSIYLSPNGRAIGQGIQGHGRSGSIHPLVTISYHWSSGDQCCEKPAGYPGYLFLKSTNGKRPGVGSHQVVAFFSLCQVSIEYMSLTLW